MQVTKFPRPEDFRFHVGKISKQTNLNQVNFISFVFVYLVGWHESCRGELVAGIGSIFVKFNLVCFNFIYLLCS
jgi:hypothetical protein